MFLLTWMLRLRLRKIKSFVMRSSGWKSKCRFLKIYYPKTLAEIKWMKHSDFLTSCTNKRSRKSTYKLSCRSKRCSQTYDPSKTRCNYRVRKSSTCNKPLSLKTWDSMQTKNCYWRVISMTVFRKQLISNLNILT